MLQVQGFECLKFMILLILNFHLCTFWVKYGVYYKVPLVVGRQHMNCHGQSIHDFNMLKCVKRFKESL